MHIKCCGGIRDTLTGNAKKRKEKKYYFINGLNKLKGLPHINLVTPLYHILEVSLVSASSDQFVGHRLISFLPWSVRISNYSVLTGRGNLEQTTVVQ